MEGWRNSEKTINLGKSSGGKQEESHLRKLDTLKEIFTKNYFDKYVEEKSFSSFKTITRSEFQRRRSSFESSPIDRLPQLDQKEKKGEEEKEKNNRKWEEGGKKEKEPPLRAYSLEDLRWRSKSPSALECSIREEQMTKKLRAIHELIEGMQEMTRNLRGSGSEREKDGRKEAWDSFKQNSILKSYKGEKNEKKKKKEEDGVRVKWGGVEVEGGGGGGVGGESKGFGSSSNLNQKLVPIHFTSSFTTELGTSWRTFTEKVIFENRLSRNTPTWGYNRKTFPPEEGKLFRTTLIINL